MKKKIFTSLLIFLFIIGDSIGAEKLVLINGAGATFPYPLYSKWFYEYTKIDPTVNFNYQSIGSGGGIRQITARTVDFGATDGPMSDEQMKQVQGEILHIPTVAGAVVVIYNIPNTTSKLNFSQKVLVDIFLGKITKWNDQQIANDNPNVNLPDKKIVLVHRSDGSGTTYIFTDYLCEISKEWKIKVGKGTSVNWPVGLGAKGNEGVAGVVKQTPHSIGYVELVYALKNNLSYACIKNKSGKYIEPSLHSITSAIASKSSSMPSDFRVSLVNPDGADAYPISGFTWILVYKNQTDKVKGEKIVKLLNWAVTEGQKYAEELSYAPLPPTVVQMIQEKLKEIKY